AAPMLLLCLLGTVPAYALCLTPRDSIKADDPHAYLSTYISSLVQARQAFLCADLTPATTTSELLLLLKLQTDDFHCAEDYMRPFTRSADPMIVRMATLTVIFQNHSPGACQKHSTTPADVQLV